MDVIRSGSQKRAVPRTEPAVAGLPEKLVFKKLLDIILSVKADHHADDPAFVIHRRIKTDLFLSRHAALQYIGRAGFAAHARLEIGPVRQIRRDTLAGVVVTSGIHKTQHVENGIFLIIADDPDIRFRG